MSRVFATQFPLAAGRRPPNKKVCRLTKEVIVVTSSLKPPPECTPAAPRTPRCTLHLIKTWIKSKTVSHATSQSRRRRRNMRGGRRHIHLHTPGTGSRRRRAAAWRGTPGVASSREEIQTGSWLWGPGRFCQAPQCKPRRGGRGAPHTFASANGPPGPPRPRPGGHGGPIQRGPAKKKSRSKPLQPSHHLGTVRSPTVRRPHRPTLPTAP